MARKNDFLQTINATYIVVCTFIIRFKGSKITHNRDFLEDFQNKIRFVFYVIYKLNNNNLHNAEGENKWQYGQAEILVKTVGKNQELRSNAPIVRRQDVTIALAMQHIPSLCAKYAKKM